MYLDLFIHIKCYNISSKYVIELGAPHLDTITTTYKNVPKYFILYIILKLLQLRCVTRSLLDFPIKCYKILISEDLRKPIFFSSPLQNFRLKQMYSLEDMSGKVLNYCNILYTKYLYTVYSIQMGVLYHFYPLKFQNLLM